MDASVIVQGNKYALLAMRVTHLDTDPAIHGWTNGEVAILAKLPIELPEHWEQWLGTLRLDEIGGSNLFILTQMPSKAPEVLDGENSALTDRLQRFYFGILMSVPYIGHVAGTMMSGAHRGEVVDVRQVQRYEDVFCIRGCHGARLDNAQLRAASAATLGVQELQGTGEHSRTWRVVNAFYAGLKAGEPGIRVHQFVRCIEGFAFPTIGKTRKQIVHRAKLFLGSGFEFLVGHLYDIRSAVEHLRGPLDAVPGTDDQGRRLMLLQRAYEAEVVARYCIQRLFTNPRVWPHFNDESALAAFWELPDAERVEVWGAQLDAATEFGRFDRAYAAFAMSM